MKFRKIKKNDILYIPTRKKYIIVSNLNHRNVLPIFRQWETFRNYWEYNYDIILPEKPCKLIGCRFSGNDTEYTYPVHKSCIKKPFRQKKALKLFLEAKKEKC